MKKNGLSCDCKKDEAEPEYSDDGEYSDAEEPAVTQSNTNVNDNATTMPFTMPPQMPMERLYDARHGQNYDPKHPPRQGGKSLSLSHSLKY